MRASENEGREMKLFLVSLVACALSCACALSSAKAQQRADQRNLAGPMQGSTPQYILQVPRPLHGAYIGRSWEPSTYSVPPQIYYNGISPGYVMGARINGGLGKEPVERNIARIGRMESAQDRSRSPACYPIMPF